MAYGLSAAGSDWQEWKVRDVRTGQDLPDHIKWVKFSGASWTKDGKGFFYSRYDEPTEGGQTHQGELFPETLLPSPRHAAVRGQAGLSSARPEGMGLRRQRSPTTAAISSSRKAGHGPEEPRVLPGLAAARTRPWSKLLNRLRRRLHVHRQRRPGLLVQDRPRTRRAAASSPSTSRSRNARTGRKSSRKPPKRWKA